MDDATQDETSSRSGPLAGVRVIDASTILAGPMTCQILGDFGADVIKIEHPEMPDGLRGHGTSVDGEGLWWKEVGRNKRNIGLRLSDEEGAQLFRRLIADTDVLVENFRPGTLERWGIGPDTLHGINPDLVILRVTGFGQTGPYARRQAFGTLAEAMSGFAHLTGAAEGPPSLPPFGLADTVSAYVAVGAVTMALYHRAVGGRGQVIDLSILEAMLSTVGPGLSAFDKTGVADSRQGNRSPNNSPRNLYRTSDGYWVAVSASALSIAKRVLTLVGHPEVIDEPWFQQGTGRVEHVEEIDEYVSSWIGDRTRDEVMRAFEEAGAAIAPVYDAQDIVNDPQVQHRQMVVDVPDDALGSVLMRNVMVRMSETPGSIRSTGRPHAVDTEEVLTERLGLTVTELADLTSRGVIA